MFSALLEAEAQPQGPESAAVLGAVATLGVLGTGVVYVLNYRIIADDGPTAASAVTYLLPVVAVFLGMLVVLGEPLAIGLVLGGALVLSGVTLVRTASNHD
ncbi:EamA family transporter [Frankia sp. Cj5]|uniref:EamA family transporter n=1 Tax=Frankia sp. Cj5 TaxID=2880978 RepID=UPI001EF5F767|nr:EamA family transporter [Frankia sp. Cj5]